MKQLLTALFDDGQKLACFHCGPVTIFTQSDIHNHTNPGFDINKSIRTFSEGYLLNSVKTVESFLYNFPVH